MCLIIIKQKSKEVSADVLKSAARINKDGLGVVWLDTYEVSYHKSKEYDILMTDRPYIAHFRYATVGKVCIENTHPFVCGKNTDELLMMNGTIKGLGNKDKTDSRVLAENLGDIDRADWRKELSQYACRFVTINLKTKSFEIFNKHLYTLKDGVWYSKDEVLADNYIAVYGTLKKGYNNYWAYLYGSHHVGKGKTKDKYPLIIQGLPYLVNKVGLGHNVNVDVFKITDRVLHNIDKLEGHPNWYKRQRIPILIGKEEVMCWVYFNPVNVHINSVFHKSYEYTIPKQVTAKPKLDYPKVKKDKSQLDECAQVSFWDDEFDKLDVIHTTRPICIGCYGDLTNDGLDNFHCGRCGSWYSENEVMRF
jgi:gamma-glutamylaminecyclotransferase